MFEALAIAVQYGGECRSVEYGLGGKHEEKDQKGWPKRLLNRRTAQIDFFDYEFFPEIVAQDGSPCPVETLISFVNLRVEVRGTEAR